MMSSHCDNEFMPNFRPSSIVTVCEMLQAKRSIASRQSLLGFNSGPPTKPISLSSIAIPRTKES